MFINTWSPSVYSLVETNKRGEMSLCGVLSVHLSRLVGPDTSQWKQTPGNQDTHQPMRAITWHLSCEPVGAYSLWGYGLFHNIALAPQCLVKHVWPHFPQAPRRLTHSTSHCARLISPPRPARPYSLIITTTKKYSSHAQTSTEESSEEEHTSCQRSV